jgi:hypothetical protein
MAGRGQIAPHLRLGSGQRQSRAGSLRDRSWVIAGRWARPAVSWGCRGRGETARRSSANAFGTVTKVDLAPLERLPEMVQDLLPVLIEGHRGINTRARRRIATVWHYLAHRAAPSFGRMTVPTTARRRFRLQVTNDSFPEPQRRLWRNKIRGRGRTSFRSLRACSGSQSVRIHPET